MPPPYRLVQEALTNALKHAGPTRARVIVRYGVDRLGIEVTNEQGAANAGSRNGTGHGLSGMRERLALYGRDLGSRAAGRRIRSAGPDSVDQDHAVIQVLLVDDQALMRAGFRMIIDAQPGLAVVGEAADGGEAVEEARRLQRDVPLMDIRMPGVDGIEATRRLVAGGSQARIVMLTTFDLDEYVFEAMRAGASGFLLKTAPPHQLTAAIRDAAAGETLVAPAITRRLVEEFVSRPRASVCHGTFGRIRRP